MKGIIAYTIKKELTKIQLTRCYKFDILDTNYNTEYFTTDDFNKAINWLTRDFGEAFHIVWNLEHFTTLLFSLLPIEKRKELKSSIIPRIYVNGQAIKIFYTSKYLGLTMMKQERYNYYKQENNFFGISHWLTNIAAPDIFRLVILGYEILTALSLMKMQVMKLTSPIAVLLNNMELSTFPTLYSNKDLLNAANYCLPMMKLEWREQFQSSVYANTFNYDIISAYPYFITDLPDTNNCLIKYSRFYQACDWGIVRACVKSRNKINPIVNCNNREYFTTDEIIWLLNHGATINIIDGYYFSWKNTRKPYRQFILQLFKAKQSSNTILAEIARRMAQGFSGKFDQENKDGSLGELYNPILAAMVRSKCRLTVADFIYDNNLQDDLVSVNVDGIQSYRRIRLENNKNIGNWRYIKIKE
jgi:hypothetical protein|tara:strand:+ start:2260 stop:3504 length:1245 start_codon:yes stop_codon:yes gene_type:complete